MPAWRRIWRPIPWPAVELSMALEEEFGVTIADEELPNMKTVGDLVKYLEDHAE